MPDWTWTVPELFNAMPPLKEVEPAPADFLKVPALHELALGSAPNRPVFAVIQGFVLMFFVVVIVGAWRRFKPMSAFA